MDNLDTDKWYKLYETCLNSWQAGHCKNFFSTYASDIGAKICTEIGVLSQNLRNGFYDPGSSSKYPDLYRISNAHAFIETVLDQATPVFYSTCGKFNSSEQDLCNADAFNATTELAECGHSVFASSAVQTNISWSLAIPTIMTAFALYNASRCVKQENTQCHRPELKA